MAGTSPPTFRKRRLGGVLRGLRVERNLTQQQVADDLGIGIDRISRAETGRTKIDVPLVRALLDVYQVGDSELRSAMEDMARNVTRRGWWHSYASCLHMAFQDFLGLESDAEHVRTFQTMLIPGLLQTEPYCRALLEAGEGIVHNTPERTRHLVSVRLERQKALLTDAPLRFSAVVSEAGLRNAIGGRDVFRRQLEHLVEMSRRPNVSLRVLPLDSGSHLGLDGPFTLFSFPDGGALASLEALVNSFYLEDEESVTTYSQAFEQITAKAMTREATRAWLEQTML